MKRIKEFIWGSQEGYVYIGCDASRAAYKIGMTIDPKARQREIRRMNPTFVIFSTFFVQDKRKTEGLLHAYFSKKRIEGEWFTLDFSDIRKVVSLIAPSGATWRHLIDRRYSNEIIEQRIDAAFAGAEYDAIIGED